MNDDEEALAQFAGMARLFPLPNLVLFPHVVQPLHIFEPRYRQLTADALEGDRLIALALLQPGWEEPNNKLPPIHPIACLGRITAHQRLDDGRYILLLRGVSRLRIVEEVESDRLYRTARAELLPDVAVLELDEAREMRYRMRDLVLASFQVSDSDRVQLCEMFEGETPLATLCDGLCYQLPLTIERKIQLLSETDVTVRVRALLGALESFAHHPAVLRRWPPTFSEN